MNRKEFQEDSEDECICKQVRMNFEPQNPNQILISASKSVSDYSSSESEEDDFFDYLAVRLSEGEFTNLTKSIDHPLVTIKPIIKIYDDRMGKSIIDLINGKVFFGAQDYEDPLQFGKKADYMLSLPNSYLPLMKKPLGANDPICAPLYMNEREAYQFTKPLMLSKKYYGTGKYGMSFKYDLDTKADMQSNFVYHQRLFFDKILKERLTNKSAYGKDAEYEFPITLYEPNTFLRRFCDMFCYISIGLEEIYSKSDYDEEVIIRKLFASLLAGFHKPMASQGIPLKPLIGETYECESENSDLKLFAEVKNDNPINIAYNIRWRGRKACLDGSVLMKLEFHEGLDEMRIKMGGVNTLRLYYDSHGSYRTFTFNFPLRCSFKGIVDPINEQPERHMSVDSFIYIKGETKSAIIGLNHLTHADIFTAFYGMITKSIVNYDMLRNGHSFFGVIFHNSGFSLENVKDGHILQAFAVNSSRNIESIEKLIEEKTKNDKMKKDKKNKKKNEDEDTKSKQEEEVVKAVDPRFVGVCWENFINENKAGVEIGNNNGINNPNTTINNNNNLNNRRVSGINRIGNFGDETILNDESHLNLKNHNFNHDESELLQKAMKNENKQNNINDSNNNNNKNLENANEQLIKKNRKNVYPFKIYYKLFKNTVVSISKLSTSSAFISSFNMHFIYKLYIGSWAHLNFFEIAYQGNEMNEFYIRYKMGQVNARPISDFNLKKGLQILIDDNNFFCKFRSLYGKLWKPELKPLVTDTRYREDLLWLMRFYEIVDKYPENERDPDRLDLYDKVRLEAFLNAGKWKEVLEAFTYLNISKKLNPKEAEGGKSQKKK